MDSVTNVLRTVDKSVLEYIAPLLVFYHVGGQGIERTFIKASSKPLALMYFIAHRGLLNGPDRSIENHPDTISKVIELGYHVEVDLRVVDGRFYLGHDTPDYEVTKEFLFNKPLFIHCKNSEALFFCLKNGLRCFSHDRDPYTITSTGEGWAYPGQPCNEDVICVLPELQPEQTEWLKARAVCTDYVTRYENLYLQHQKQQ